MYVKILGSPTWRSWLFLRIDVLMCRKMFFQKYEASKSTFFIFYLELPLGFPSLSLSPVEFDADFSDPSDTMPRPDLLRWWALKPLKLPLRCRNLSQRCGFIPYLHDFLGWFNMNQGRDYCIFCYLIFFIRTGRNI